VIAFFMVLSAGDLAGTDCKLGRIGTVDAAPPSRLARVGIVGLSALIAGILGYLVAILCGAGGVSLPIMIAWKGALGAVVGGLLAARAARWQLSLPRSQGARGEAQGQ
jgi:membrane associated rhomboid family serine protease